MDKIYKLKLYSSVFYEEMLPLSNLHISGCAHIHRLACGLAESLIDMNKNELEFDCLKLG